MSPAAAGVRQHLFVQAAVTLLFGLLRPAPSSGWTVATVAVAVAAVGLGAALSSTHVMRNAVLGFEVAALAFGVLGLVAGHYVPGTIVGLHLLIKLWGISSAEFAAALDGSDPGAGAGLGLGVPRAPEGSTPPWAAQPPAQQPPWATPAQAAPPAAAPTGPPAAPTAAPPAAPPAPPQAPAAPVMAALVPAPVAVVPSGPPVAAPWAAPGHQALPYLPPQPGQHPAGRTVVPTVTV
ncbi:MAG TPA: hypothetical protein VMZ00_08250, partial [Sporichthya sp.]|nr:hypothetical protein [Sporichthya sp.]